ncbi:MAG: type III-A CRISPR-associated RAMP protein Csm3 [Christensenellales bacterium]
MNKIIIKGIIEVKTGMHIGGNSAYSAIGMIDSPVIKDKITKLPIIPGSSIKGKMRTLLSLAKNDKVVDFDDDGIEILRLFGSSKKGSILASRLQFRDCFYIKEREIDSPYEIKYENLIIRKTLVAKPRQIERVVRGAKFDFRLTYNVVKQDEMGADIENIIQALKLLQLDYLGGGGSRGNGRILFTKLQVLELNDEGQLEVNEDLTNKFADIEAYGNKIYDLKNV